MEHLMLVADVISAATILATLIILSRNIRDFWGTSTAEAFVYYGSGAFLLGLISVFMHMSLEHVIPVNESGRTLAWHTMFYLSMGMFVSGTAALLRLDTSAQVPNFTTILRRAVLVVVVGGAVFGAAIIADDWATRVFGGSVLDRMGAVHVLAFIMCIAVVRVLRRLSARLSSYLSSIAQPVTWAVFLFGVVHLWELLSESWRMITLPGEWGEMLEMLLIAAACIFTFLAFLRTRRRMG